MKYGIPLHIWERRELKPRPGNPNKRETHVPIECPNCGMERMLKLHDARKALNEERMCTRCKCQKAGYASFRTYISLYGWEGWLKRIQKTQLEKTPPKSETEMKDILSEVLPAGLYFVWQYIYCDYVVDFMILNEINEPVFVIEMNGYWHRKTRGDRDKQLVKRSKVPVLFFDSEMMDTDEGKLAAVETITQHIQEVYRGTKKV